MRMRKMKKVVILMLSFVLVFQNCLGVLAAPTVSVSENTVSENAVPQNDASGDIIVSPSEEVTAESDAEVKLSVESEEITAEGAGSSFATATSIATNTSYQGKMTGLTEKEYYKFTLPKSGVVSLTISHELYESSNYAWYMEIYNSSYERIDTTKASTGYIESVTGTQIGLAAGTYYIIVTGYSGYTNRTYAFTVNYEASEYWEKEFNNSWITATPISTNKTYHGAISYWDSADYYKFTLPEDGVIVLSISHELYEHAYKGWHMYLYTPTGSSYKQLYTMSSTNGYFEEARGMEIGLPAGTYYLQIVEGFGGDRTYNFDVTYYSTDAYETEFNDSWLTADEANVNNRTYGSTMSDGDVDYYKFNMPYSGYAQLVFWHEIYNSSDKGWKIELYDENHTSIGSFYSSSGNRFVGNYIQSYLRAGRYYVVVRKNSDSQEKTYWFETNLQPKKGSVITINKIKYKVTDNNLSSPKVECVGPSSKSIKSATIESTVTINNFKYNVTNIKSSAFKNCKKLKKITIGSNVKTIGSNAFYNCKKLESITVKTKKITKVGKNALKGIHKKARIKCPKSKLSKYKKLFKNKGQKSTVKFK